MEERHRSQVNHIQALNSSAQEVYGHATGDHDKCKTTKEVHTACQKLFRRERERDRERGSSPAGIGRGVEP